MSHGHLISSGAPTRSSRGWRLLIEHIQIQTDSHCNGNCPYCPYPSLHQDLDMGRMDEALFYRIVDQAIDLEPQRIIPYLMNEPLLDDRLPDFVRYIRERSDCLIEISTNALAMDHEKRKWLSDIENGLVLLNINNYTDPNVINKFIAHRGRSTIVGIIYPMSSKKLVYYRQIFHRYVRNLVTGSIDDRSGNVKWDDGFTRVEEGHCYEERLDKWLHILWNGDVILCCQDWKRQHVLGNVKDMSLRDVWMDEPYRKVREDKPELCKKCARWIP